MSDWPTAVVALTSACAGLAGAWLQSWLQDASREKDNQRADLELVRRKVTETLAEADRIHNEISRQGVLAILGAARPGVEDAGVADLVATGALRSNIAIYFPECLPALAAFEAAEMRALEQMSRDLREGDLRVATVVYSTARTAASRDLLSMLQQQLTGIARSRLGPTL